MVQEKEWWEGRGERWVLPNPLGTRRGYSG